MIFNGTPVTKPLIEVGDLVSREDFAGILKFRIVVKIEATTQNIRVIDLAGVECNRYSSLAELNTAKAYQFVAKASKLELIIRKEESTNGNTIISN